MNPICPLRPSELFLPTAHSRMRSSGTGRQLPCKDQIPTCFAVQRLRQDSSRGSQHLALGTRWPSDEACGGFEASSQDNFFTGSTAGSFPVPGALNSSVSHAWNKRARMARWPGHKGLVRAAVRMPGGNGGAAKDTREFVLRLEQVWGISKHQRPVPCPTCTASGIQECPWCNGTGFFILGDSMLCEVSSHNTKCRVCHGEGVLKCEDCRGTGKRAGWMPEPPDKRRLGEPLH